MGPATRVFILLAALLMMPMAAHATPVSVIVPGSANPWLAGMPDGWMSAVGDDMAPDQAPVEVPSLPLSVGLRLQFAATGQTAFGPSKPMEHPDGFGFHPHVGGAENGTSDVNVPTSSLLGVFLTAERPDLAPAPLTLDFALGGNVIGGIDYSTVAPLLQQVFFIGDGITGDGTPQSVIVPDGATRLFLGTKDGYDWHNNLGSLVVMIDVVPEPTGAAIALAAIVAIALTTTRCDRRLPSTSAPAMGRYDASCA